MAGRAARAVLAGLLTLSTLLTLLAAPACQAQAMAPVLGRLFTTPAERAALDLQRSRGNAPPVVAAAAEPAPAPAAPPPPITLNGVVRPSSGAPTIWLNDNAQTVPNSMLKGGRTPSGAVSIETPGGQHLTLKAGQTYDMGSGTVRDQDAAPR